MSEEEEQQDPKHFTVLTQDHGVLISKIWDAMGRENHTAIFQTVHDVLEKELEQDKAENPEHDGTVRFTQVVSAGWAMGFNHCLAMIEGGLLVPMGKTSKDVPKQSEN